MVEAKDCITILFPETERKISSASIFSAERHHIELVLDFAPAIEVELDNPD